MSEGTEPVVDNSAVNSGDGTQQAGNWYDALPDDLRKEEYIPTLNKFKPGDDGKLVPMPPNVVKSYLEAQKKINQKGVLLPEKNASKEEKDAFFEALGRPKTPDGYDFKKPDILPTGVGWDEDKAKRYGKIFFESGIPKEAAVKLFTYHTEEIFQETKQYLKELEETKGKQQADLKNEFGSNYDREMAGVDAVMKVYGGKDFLDLVEQYHLKYHPALVMFARNIKNRIGEGSLRDGYVDKDRVPLTKEDIEARMKDARYKGHPHQQDPEYIKKIEEDWRRLKSGEKAASGQ